MMTWTLIQKIIPAYELHGHILENVSPTKYPGVTIQDDQRWGSHISSTTRPSRPSASSGAAWRSATEKGNCVQSPCSPISWVCSHCMGSLHCKWDLGHWEGPTQSSKMGLQPTPPDIMRWHHAWCPRLASTPRTMQESSTGDVLQVPLWSCLHQLQLPAKIIRQQIELQTEQHLQLRHHIQQATIQTDVVLPQDHTRLERTAPGGCDSWVTGLF